VAGARWRGAWPGSGAAKGPFPSPVLNERRENARAMQFGPLLPEQMMEIETLLERQ
jgi:hypothetical protein